MVDLSTGYKEVSVRHENDKSKLSFWYFKDEELLAVDTINNTKAYVFGTKFIKIDKVKLVDASLVLKTIAS